MVKLLQNRWCCGLFLLVMPLLMVQADPTRPPGWGAPARTAVTAIPLQLQQITHRAIGTSAVINGQLVRVGDQVDGARVVSILPDHVVVEVQKQRRKLTLSTIKDVKRNQQ